MTMNAETSGGPVSVQYRMSICDQLPHMDDVVQSVNKRLNMAIGAAASSRPGSMPDQPSDSDANAEANAERDADRTKRFFLYQMSRIVDGLRRHKHRA